LEQANLSKEGKKSRMTPERFKLLDDLGFKWSSPTPARARRNRQVEKKADGSNGDDDEEQKEASSNEPAPMIKLETDVPADSAAVEEKAVETQVSAQAEAITAATNVVGNLSAVEESANEQNHGFVQEAIEGETAAEEETTKTDDRDPDSLETENPVTIV
jgi:predicted HNH restriction endonuclease